MGAMGFIMMTDVLRKLRHHEYRISFTTKVIAVITTGLTCWSTLHLFFFEPTIQGMPTANRLLASWFHSMSAITTVGFNTIDTSTVCAVTMIVLMFIGRVGVITLGNVMLVRASAESAKRRSDLVV